MTLAYTKKLGFWTSKTDVKLQKIDIFSLATYKKVPAGFWVLDKLDKNCLLQEGFLLANNGVNVIMVMFFLTLSNIDILFTNWELTQRFYSAAKALSTTRRIEIIDKKEFIKAALMKMSRFL